MSLREIEEQDLKKILEWRNSDFVRLNMFSQEIIELNQHYDWFKRMKADESSVWWLYSDLIGRDCGVVYFTDIDYHKGFCFWGFYISPDSKKGIGKLMANEALREILSKPEINEVYGDVLEFNNRSRAFHEKLGFRVEKIFKKKHEINNQFYDVIRYVMSGKEFDLIGEKI